MGRRTHGAPGSRCTLGTGRRGDGFRNYQPAGGCYLERAWGCYSGLEDMERFLLFHYKYTPQCARWQIGGEGWSADRITDKRIRPPHNHTNDEDVEWKEEIAPRI